MEEETKEEQPEKIVQTWVKSINFHHLCEIKGLKGVYVPCTEANKSGMILMQRYMTTEKKIWVKSSTCVLLGSYCFELDSGGKIGIAEVFENIEANYGKITLRVATVRNFLDLIVPDYDSEKFKHYQAVKVLKWFAEIKEKMIAYVEEGEREMEEEEINS